MSGDRFLEEYLHQDSIVSDYRKAQRWSSPSRLLILYFGISVLAIVINSIIESVFNIEISYFGIQDFTAAIVMIIGVLILLIIMISSVDKISSTGLQDKDIVYHYIAKSLSSFNQSPDRDYVGIESGLNDAMEYIESRDVAFAHPRVEQALQEYVSKLDDFESEDHKKTFIDETYDQVVGQIVDSILKGESADFDVETNIDIPTSEEESSLGFIWRTISEFFSERRIKIAIPILILISSLIAFPIFGSQVTFVILAAYPVLNSLLGLTQSQKTEES